MLLWKLAYYHILHDEKKKEKTQNKKHNKKNLKKKLNAEKNHCSKKMKGAIVYFFK